MTSILAQAQAPVADEYNDLELEVSGTLPPTLHGALYRNGPGRFERGGVPYGHAFDGDGHIARFELRGGRAFYRNRFVRTDAYLAEERAGRMLWRGFGTQKPGGLPANLLRLHFKNAANTHVIAHAARLLALWEGGPPHRLDPKTLATLGPEGFDGQLRNRFDPISRWTTPLLPFSAHPQIDAETGELHNFGLVLGRPTRLILYRVDADGRMATPDVHPLERFTFVHQIAVSKRWICVLLPYADFDVPRALLGLRSPAASLKLDTDRPMQALLIPRNGGPSRRIETGIPGFVFHIAQAVDTEDGGLALDVVRYPSFPALGDVEQFFDEAERRDTLPRLEHLKLDPQQGCCTLTRRSDTGFELPTSAPGRIGAQRRHLYGIGMPPGRRLPFFSTISRFDTVSGELTQRDLGTDLPSEPVPTAAASEDEEWLLSLVYRASEHRSDLLVLNAADLQVEATIHLPHPVPPGFHGCWVPADQSD